MEDEGQNIVRKRGHGSEDDGDIMDGSVDQGLSGLHFYQHRRSGGNEIFEGSGRSLEGAIEAFDTRTSGCVWSRMNTFECRKRVGGDV